MLAKKPLIHECLLLVGYIKSNRDTLPCTFVKYLVPSWGRVYNICLTLIQISSEYHICTVLSHMIHITSRKLYLRHFSFCG